MVSFCPLTLLTRRQNWAGAFDPQRLMFNSVQNGTIVIVSHMGPHQDPVHILIGLFIYRFFATVGAARVQRARTLLTFLPDPAATCM